MRKYQKKYGQLKILDNNPEFENPQIKESGGIATQVIA